MLRLLRPLTTLLGLVLLTANAASALALASAENRASGSAAVAEHLVGQNTRLSEEATRENLTLRYDLASDSPCSRRGRCGNRDAVCVGSTERIGRGAGGSEPSSERRDSLSHWYAWLEYGWGVAVLVAPESSYQSWVCESDGRPGWDTKFPSARYSESWRIRDHE
jgi:hypothetical protein